MPLRPRQLASTPDRLLIRTAALSAGAAVLTATTLALAFVVWIVGQGQYLNDYCFTRAPQPQGMTEATGGFRGPVFEGPLTLRCIWEDHRDVFVFDAAPVLWGAGCLIATLLTVAVIWWITLSKLHLRRNANRAR